MVDKRNTAVSVIIPCYNQAHFLRESIESLQKQTLSEWECIVVDDGSKDQTAEVVRMAADSDPRIKYCYQTNKGLSAARNRGLRIARGDYLLFLDADDLIEHEKLRISVEILQINQGIDALASAFRYFRNGDQNTLFCNKNGNLSPWAEQVWADPRPFLEKLLVFNFMSVNSVVIRASAAQKIGAFNEALKALEDWEYWLRGACQGVTFQFHDEPSTRSLIRVHSASMSYDEKTMLRAEIVMRRHVGSIMPNNLLKRINCMRAVDALRRSGCELSISKRAWMTLTFMGPFYCCERFLHKLASCAYANYRYIANKPS